MIKDLLGLLSEKTLISKLPFVDDADAEIARKEEERKKTLEEGDPYAELGQPNEQNKEQEVTES